MSEQKSSDAPLMLSVSGLRGIVGESLTPEVAARYAGAFGAWLNEQVGGAGHVVIGRDGRLGGEAMHHAAIGGLLGAGCVVTDLGIASTPTVGASASVVDGGMIVTASHNPAEWNGLKCLVTQEMGEGGADGEQDGSGAGFGLARAPFANEAEAYIAAFRERTPVRAEPPAVGSSYRVEQQASGAHWTAMLGLYGELLMGAEGGSGEVRPLRIVLDAVNASGSLAAVPMLDAVGEVVQLYCSGSGVFPHTPEPTAANLGGLCDAVKGLKADIGFAVDPDADRLAIVDEHGAYIGEELTLALSAMSLLMAIGEQDDGGEPLVLCTNLSTSRLIEDVADRFGARVVRTAVGEANVVQGMMETGAVLGGEGNGGVIWPELSFVRDSLAGMVLVLALLQRTGKRVSELVAELPSYAIVKRKVELAERSLADAAAEKVAEAYKGRGTIDRQDGVRVDISDYEKSGQAAWLHVRASNTEPIMRLIAEAGSAELAERLLDEAAGVIG